jgi:hypothetical protein
MDTPGWGVAAAEDGLILITKGASGRGVTASFYTYMYATPRDVTTRLDGSIAGLAVLGYSRRRLDLPNHYVPNLGYTFYFRPTRTLQINLEPVVYETMGSRLMGCVKDPLGLTWLPTSRWQPGQVYQVRMDTLETSWNDIGTAKLSMEMLPMSADDVHVSCGQLWARHGRLWKVGTLGIGL